jgi:preprotein translocase SecE subunit
MASAIVKVKIFFSEMFGELKKSSWPAGKDLGRSTVVVVIGMFFISLYTTAVDFSLFNIVDFISKLVRS